jgi:hypothetical protein
VGTRASERALIALTPRMTILGNGLVAGVSAVTLAYPQTRSTGAAYYVQCRALTAVVRPFLGAKAGGVGAGRRPVGPLRRVPRLGLRCSGLRSRFHRRLRCCVSAFWGVRWPPRPLLRYDIPAERSASAIIPAPSSIGLGRIGCGLIRGHAARGLALRGVPCGPSPTADGIPRQSRTAS